MKIILTHNSDHPDATGRDGDTIECPDELAQRFIDGGGAVAVDTPEPETPEPDTTPPRTRRKKS